MPEKMYNVEVLLEHKEGKKWFYFAQTKTKDAAVTIASQHQGGDALDFRIRKVVKTIVWKESRDNASKREAHS